MLKNWGVLVVLLGCSVGFSISTNADWYMDITYSGIDGGLEGDGKRLGFVNELEVDNTSAGWQLTGGFELNQYAAFEVSYVDLGRQSTNVNGADGDGFYGPSCPSPVDGASSCYFFNPFSGSITPDTLTGQPGVTPSPTSPAPVFGRSPLLNTFGNFSEYPGGYNAGSKVDTRIRGLRLAMIGNLPITDRIKGSFQGGALIPDYKSSVTTVSYLYTIDPYDPFLQITEVVNKETETSHEPALFIGLGFQVDLTSKIGMKLSWEKYLDVGEDDYLEQSLDTYNLSMRLRF